MNVIFFRVFLTLNMKKKLISENLQKFLSCDLECHSNEYIIVCNGSFRKEKKMIMMFNLPALCFDWDPKTDNLISDPLLQLFFNWFIVNWFTFLSDNILTWLIALPEV